MGKVNTFVMHGHVFKQEIFTLHKARECNTVMHNVLLVIIDLLYREVTGAIVKKAVKNSPFRQTLPFYLINVPNL